MDKNLQDYVRSNLFDQWVGKRQTLKAVELGVGKSILDIGCGIGQFTPFFLKKFTRVVGLDPDAGCLERAKKAGLNIEYVLGYGETFRLDEKFDTISMTNLAEHVDDPTALLLNCKQHLAPDGRIIVQVPNANSLTRRLGVEMGFIPNVYNMSDKERNFWGHRRVYTLSSLIREMHIAGLKVLEYGGILLKFLPNEILLKVCKEQGEEWQEKFIDALIELGKDRPEDCAQLYVCCN